MKDLINRLKEAMNQMSKGVHSPGHIAAIADAVRVLEKIESQKGETK